MPLNLGLVTYVGQQNVVEVPVPVLSLSLKGTCILSLVFLEPRPAAV